tara:strand:+ start:1746 stop:2549 length:804 start_codon:yes stop_codon:yes gene_type:complete
MLGQHFYNEAIRKTVVGFGTLFNNIELKKVDPSTGAVLEVEKVPLAYGPKQKFLTRLEQNPDVANKVAITIPRLYFEMTAITYDSARKTSPVQKYRTVIDDNGKEVKTQYVPVPYDMSFELGIIAKSQDDGLQILEQILPFFQPNFNIAVNMVKDMDERKDIAIVLNNINYEDDWDDSFLDRRSIVWTLNFVAKSYIYGPYTNTGIIRKAIIYESVGDLAASRRNAAYSYSPKALEDNNSDGQITTADDELVISTDDFGFNEGIDIL